ncbi:hypothetical protein [Petrimonas sp.]|uniref:hypothetical protein n=1 Tax=Petrimonas sp. TaxID=2023866 RepID=UPI003F51181F
MEISARYEISFLEIGYECDHFILLQSVSSYSVTKIATKLKILTVSESFFETSGKKQLWGGNFYISGFLTLFFILFVKKINNPTDLFFL